VQGDQNKVEIIKTEPQGFIFVFLMGVQKIVVKVRSQLGSIDILQYGMH